MQEKDEEMLAKEQARHMMLAPLRGQQLKTYVSGIRNQLNAERQAEKRAAYIEAVTKYACFDSVHVWIVVCRKCLCVRQLVLQEREYGTDSKVV